MAVRCAPDGSVAGAPPCRPIPCPLSGVPVHLIGEGAVWFDVRGSDDDLRIEPKKALPRRCTIRPVALFRQERGFPDVKTVMGRLVFGNGATGAQRYRPWTHDPRLALRELFLPAEPMPDDDWSVSANRWRNFELIAKRLCDASGVAWRGLADAEVDTLVEFVPWPEPLEGCLLHALTQWACEAGQCVVEIGSRRGRSLSMLALALRGAGSDALLISIDPHAEHPHNASHVRLAVRQLGEEGRLVQLTCTSDRAARLLRTATASLVFIDGDHRYEQVVRDFEGYCGIVAPGGILAFHDYGYGDHNARPEADPGVRAAVDEVVFGSGEFEPLLLAHTLLAFVKRS